MRRHLSIITKNINAIIGKCINNIITSNVINSRDVTNSSNGSSGSSNSNKYLHNKFNKYNGTRESRTHYSAKGYGKLRVDQSTEKREEQQKRSKSTTKSNGTKESWKIASSPYLFSHSAEHQYGEQKRENDCNRKEEVEEIGWRYETIDASTGETELEKVYDTQLKSIHRILASPLPRLPPDGSVNPDFFVGFAYYSYDSRELYRSLIADALRLPAHSIRLSVSWSGRFAVKQFNKVQKVCGVLIDREMLQHTEYADKESRKHVYNKASSTINEETKFIQSNEALPPDLKEKIGTFIKEINKRNDERWLRYHLVQASQPIPEVEFALHNKEHQLLHCVFNWVKHCILQRHVVVIVYGCYSNRFDNKVNCVTNNRLDNNNNNNNSNNNSNCNSNNLENAINNESANINEREEETRQMLQHILCKLIKQTEIQAYWVETKWMKVFYNRKVIPRAISINEIVHFMLQQVIREQVIAFQHITETRRATEIERNLFDDNSVQATKEQEKYTEKQVNEKLENATEMNDNNNDKTSGSSSSTKSSSSVNSNNSNAKEVWQLLSFDEQSSLQRYVNYWHKLTINGNEQMQREEIENTTNIFSYRNIMFAMNMMYKNKKEEEELNASDIISVLGILNLIKQALLINEYKAQDVNTNYISSIKGNTSNNDSGNERRMIRTSCSCDNQHNAKAPEEEEQQQEEEHSEIHCYDDSDDNDDRLLPALFLHGAYAGGRDEMRYLQANKIACDAVILHPNDITVKKEFAKRLERGRSRLRIHEEINAMTHHR